MAHGCLAACHHKSGLKVAFDICGLWPVQRGLTPCQAHAPHQLYNLLTEFKGSYWHLNSPLDAAGRENRAEMMALIQPGGQLHLSLAMAAALLPELEAVLSHTGACQSKLRLKDCTGTVL